MAESDARVARVPRVACDACGCRADAIHFLPWITDCTEVRFSCINHDHGGYWIPVNRFWRSVRHICDSKRNGWSAVGVLFARIQTAEDFAESLWPRGAGPFGVYTAEEFLKAGDEAEHRLVAAIPDPPNRIEGRSA